MAKYKIGTPSLWEKIDFSKQNGETVSIVGVVSQIDESDEEDIIYLIEAQYPGIESFWVGEWELEDAVEQLFKHTEER